jgi:peptidoglycan/xylan/chitin deacetylase (PgdA/CDA1 family)
MEMSLKSRLLPALYRPFRMKNIIMRELKKSKKGRLRVLLYHDISTVNAKAFLSQLEWLRRSWHFITPAEFATMISGERPIERDSLLLSFDDGFLSNRLIADSILAPMGIKAIFFVITNFALLSESMQCAEFIVENICPGMHLDMVPKDWINMTLPDLEHLLRQGHELGAHTASHARLSEIHSPLELECEIVESADKLESYLGTKIDHFAYTFGDVSSFSDGALAIARSRFKFVHTGMRGGNEDSINHWAIRRDALNPSDSVHMVGAYLEGATDFLYKRKLNLYESWGVVDCR